jgi:ABC-type dipeptide/oligopeptide/nickel transport system permease component
MEALNRRYGLDDPIWKQYLTYLWNILHFDFGLSFRGDRDVAELIRGGFFVTVQLGTLGFIVASVVGLTLGILSALNQNGILDYVGVFFATIGAALPNFLLAAFLIIIFAINLGWFDVLGWGGPTQLSDALDPDAWDWKKWSCRSSPSARCPPPTSPALPGQACSRCCIRTTSGRRMLRVSPTR